MNIAYANTASLTLFIVVFVSISVIFGSYLFKSTYELFGSKSRWQKSVVMLPLSFSLFCLSVPLFGLHNVGNVQGIIILFANLLFVLSTATVTLLIFYLTAQLTTKKIYLCIGLILLYAVYFEVLRQTDSPKRQLLTTLTVSLIFLWPLLLVGKQLWQQRASIHLRFLSIILFFTSCFWLTRITIAILTLFYPSAVNNTDLIWGSGSRIVAAVFHIILLVLISNRFFELKTILLYEHAQQNETQMLSSLNAISLARDNETGQHILRTKIYVKNIALRLRQLGLHTEYLSDQKIEALYKAAPLHDIGKVGIPDHILLKNGKLSTEEWLIMKTHTIIGENILKAADPTTNTEQNVMAIALEICGSHHERWDGGGYPRGIKGDNIPLPARIMALADVYDALISNRIYKATWSHEDACKDIISKSGTHFDPQIVQAFKLEMSAFQKIALQYQDPA